MCFFQFYSNFNRIFCKQTRRPDKTARSVASDLGLPVLFIFLKLFIANVTLFIFLTS